MLSVEGWEDRWARVQIWAIPLLCNIKPPQFASLKPIFGPTTSNTHNNQMFSKCLHLILCKYDVLPGKQWTVWKKGMYVCVCACLCSVLLVCETDTCVQRWIRPITVMWLLPSFFISFIILHHAFFFIILPTSSLFCLYPSKGANGPLDT